MIGPGKYDEACTKARESTKARGVVLIVFDGENGNGFSVQGDAAVITSLPRVLRAFASSIEYDIGQGPLNESEKGGVQ